MKCERCGKNDSAVKLTRVEKTGQAVQIQMCQECAAEASIFQKKIMQQHSNVDLLLKELLKQHSANETEEEFGAEVPTCHSCGLTFTHYRKTLMLGCADCYDSFDEQLQGDLLRLHRTTRHVGDAPSGSQRLLSLNEQVRTCRDELKSALDFEDFERAVFLRDEIARLEHEIKQETGGVTPGSSKTG